MRVMSVTLVSVAVSIGLPAFAGGCPSAVGAAVEKAHSGAKMLACKSEHEEGANIYEAKVQTTDGKKLEMDIRPDGTIVQTEEQIAVSEVPAAATQAVRAKYSDATIKEAERVTAGNGDISYELAFSARGGKRSMTITATGAVLAEEAD